MINNLHWHFRDHLRIIIILLCWLPGTGYSEYWLYTVRPGDNIWNLTEEYLSDMRYWRPLQTLNQVRNPEYLPPGSRLRIPVAWLKTQPTVARVVDVQGKAEVVAIATSQRAPLTVNVSLVSGDIVYTGPDSSIKLEFGDGSQLLLQANSQLIMDNLSRYGTTSMVNTRLRLQGGRVDNQVKPQRQSGRFEIRTPAAVSAVRGTQYRISAAANPSVSRIEVVEGRVSVSGRGKTRLVPDRFGTVVRTNRPPETPVRLLPPPNIATLPAIIERVPIPVSFSPLSGAVAYRVQIAPAREFKALLFDRLSNASQIRGPILPDGDYVLRVRGVDSKGLEGLDAYHHFTLNARPEPPTLVTPKPHAMILDRLPLFQWSELQQVAGYHFQLAADEQFSHVLIDIPEHPQPALAVDRVLPFARYYWRVATLGSTGEQGPFSDPQSFRLQAASKVDTPIVAEDSIMLRWSAGLPGQRYQIQMAKEPEFVLPVIDTTVSEPQLVIHYPDSGFYYLRIRTIDADNSPGPYSPVQRITVPARSYLPLFTVFTILVIVLAL